MFEDKVINKKAISETIEQDEYSLNSDLIHLLKKGFKFTGSQNKKMRTPIIGYLELNFQDGRKEIVFDSNE